jgi:tetratricopeptide (TPR) repeat protein
MRGLLIFITLMVIVGFAVMRFGTPAKLSDGAAPTLAQTGAEAEKAAIMKVMNDAVAARHHGILPKTMSKEDTEVAAQAAIEWKAKQAADDHDSCVKISRDVTTAICRTVYAVGGTSPAEPAANRGRDYLLKGDLDRAIKDYDEAIRLDPNFAIAYINRGIAYNSKGNPYRAIADYNEAIRLDPNMATAYNSRGLVYLRRGDLDRANADYNEAIRIDPKFASAYNNRAIIYLRRGELDRASADYNEAIRLDPKFYAPYYGRGLVYSDRGDLNRAIPEYDEAIRLHPKDTNSYVGRGVANLYAGVVPKALADFEQASAIDPKDAYVALWLDIASQRGQIASPLPQAAAQLDMTKWPAPVIRLFLGQTTQAAVLATANSLDRSKNQGPVCVANFYSGELALRQSINDDAVRLFRLAAEECSKDSPMWFGAMAELKALGALP